MITYEQARRLFSYNQRTGILRWRVRPRGRTRPGNVAGCPSDTGHLQVRIFGKKYYAHRIIWLWMTGSWPIEETDHRDLNPGNNRWTNLREATKTQNRRNKSKGKNTLSPFKGVSKSGKRWRARIKQDGIERVLGYFDSPLIAHKAYSKAAKMYHGEFARIM